MRLLSLLYAFYFACLACMTCADEAAECRQEAQTTVAATTHTDCRRALGDWCSPLCQCHCCGAVLLLPAVPADGQVRLSGREPSLRHPLLIVAAPTRAAGTVWQPPQV